MRTDGVLRDVRNFDEDLVLVQLGNWNLLDLRSRFLFIPRDQ